MLISLVGMPAAGKTTIGKKIARQLDLPFWDLDQVIEKAENRRIKDIFAREGEAHFRKLEAYHLEQMLKQTQGILATGGGAPCFFDNMAKIRAKSLSIYIDVPLSNLVERMLANQKRPLYAKHDKNELFVLLREVYEKRHYFYQQAHLKWKF